jgi:hypothetical protein
MKEKIAYWYSKKLWTVDMVRNAVVKNLITVFDYKEITGKDY